MSREFTARLGFISLSTSSFYGPVNFSGSSLVGIGTGSVLFTNASGSVTGSSNLVWDNVNGRLGIGTSSPSFKIDVNGNARISSQNDILTLIGSATKTTFKMTGLVGGYTEVVGNGTDFYLTTNGNTNISFITNNVERTKIFGTTGNLTLQNGGTFTDAGYRLDVNGSGAASGSLRISGSTTQPVVVGNSLTSVNIVPTMVFTTGSQTQTAFKVMPTFSGSSAFTSSQSNIIADFGATSVGSQLIVTDVTSGSIYMVNDVSGIPIAEATSDWNFLLYDYPYTVFKKTGSMIELGVPNQTSSFTLFKSDLIVNEGLGFYQRTSQVSGSTNGAVTSSLYNIQFTNTSASVYISAIVTGYDTGSRDTIAGDIKATIRYRGGVASIVGIDQTFINTDNSVVGFDIVAGGTSGSLVAFGTGSRVYQWGATITTQVI